MLIPKLDATVSVQISAKVHASESSSKVSKAIENVSGGVKPIKVEEDGFIIFSYDSEAALHNLFRKIRERRVIAVARRLLLKGVVGGTTTIMINKQVAFSGGIVLCEEEDESPLGPIYMKIESSNISKVIDWLAGSDDLKGRKE
ncbi:MAG: RNA-binding domain-containing protein [Candidatus Bathyarchaeia archaeon]